MLFLELCNCGGDRFDRAFVEHVGDDAVCGRFPDETGKVLRRAKLHLIGYRRNLMIERAAEYAREYE